MRQDNRTQLNACKVKAGTNVVTVQEPAHIASRDGAIADVPEVYVVADDSSVLALFEAMLTPLVECRIHYTTEAADALDFCGGNRPRLVVVDYYAAELDSFKLCATIKSRCGAATRVLIISDNSGPDDLDQAAAVGADVLVKRPFSPTVLLRLMTSLL